MGRIIEKNYRKWSVFQAKSTEPVWELLVYGGSILYGALTLYSSDVTG